MKCAHEAWEEFASSRKCADCGQWLEPIVKPAANFQVGDRVSVEGVVTSTEMDFDAMRETAMVRVKSGGEVSLYLSDLTLVERPKRKLRVGSVWERRNQQGDARWMVVDDEYVICLRKGRSGHREKLAIDRFDALGDPAVWREVSVEELEAEANA